MKQNKYGTIFPPVVHVQRGNGYRGHDVLFNYRISCFQYVNNTSILLTNSNPMQILKTINLTEVICSANVTTSICQYNSQQALNSTPSCNSLLCYSFQIKYNNSLYKAKEKCISILDHYLKLSLNNARAYFCPLISSFSLFFCFLIFSSCSLSVP